MPENRYDNTTSSEGNATSKLLVSQRSSNEATTSNSKRKQLSGPQHRMLLCNCNKLSRNEKSASSRKPVKE